MDEHGKSDSLVVPTKPPNNAGGPAAEAVEERGLAEGNTDRPTRPGRSAGEGVPSGLDRVREVARRDKEARFTALLHHVDLARLWAAYVAINPKAAPGVDQVTWDAYGAGPPSEPRRPARRVHSGAYRASPSRRVYIPKPDGRLRPLGIATLEDKILQRAVVEVLNAVYEEDFLGFSYGFRPGRSPHDALDALAVGITEKKVNWVLDADISDFFSKLDQAWMEKFLEHRIADKRVLRLIGKWLNAGVIEDGNWSETSEGSPQGASVSPLLANVYLHYVFDRWVRQWRKRHARGDMIVTRFADDFVVGFEHLGDAKQFLRDLRERFAKFNLELHPDKTRLIEFGRFAAAEPVGSGAWQAGDVRFLGLHPRLWEDEGRALLAPAHHHQEEDEGEAEAGECRASAAPTLAHPRAGALAGERGARAPRLLRRAGQHRRGHRLFVTRSEGTGGGASASKPAPPDDLGAVTAGSLLGGCLLPASCIPTPACASPPGPKAGAQCASSARWDLSGGPPARAVPTGISADGRDNTTRPERRAPASSRHDEGGEER